MYRFFSSFPALVPILCIGRLNFHWLLLQWRLPLGLLDRCSSDWNCCYRQHPMCFNCPVWDTPPDWDTLLALHIALCVFRHFGLIAELEDFVSLCCTFLFSCASLNFGESASYTVVFFYFLKLHEAELSESILHQPSLPLLESVFHFRPGYSCCWTEGLHSGSLSRKTRVKVSAQLRSMFSSPAFALALWLENQVVRHRLSTNHPESPFY